MGQICASNANLWRKRGDDAAKATDYMPFREPEKKEDWREAKKRFHALFVPPET